MRAPRAWACSSVSRISTPAPSPITKPSRPASHGREARPGLLCAFSRGGGAPAGAGANDPPEALPFLFRAGELRVGHRHVSGGDGVLNEGIELLDFLLLEPLRRLEAADLAGDLGGVLRR